uniref:C-type lectin domain-containing protein n=1 Tax=Acrobeloides nanus TaxID=290746 RepID=A0A914C0K2_9BILA
MDNFRCAEDTYCLNKLVLFTAIDDNATVVAAENIANKINDSSFIIFIGLNQKRGASYLNIGRRLYYNIPFTDYHVHKGTPIVPFLQDVLCKMNIPTPKSYKCGQGYCESIVCGHLDNGYMRCQYFTECIHEQCYYWRHSGRQWGNAKKYCEIINSSLVTIHNETVQKELYKIIGDFEYWTGLYSDYAFNRIWKWHGTNKTLADTNFTNWADDQPNSNDYCDDKKEYGI